MSTFKCQADETLNAYVCILLFDSIGYELHPQAVQERKGKAGLGVYCTLDREKALASGKEVLVAEFRPTSPATSLLQSVPSLSAEQAAPAPLPSLGPKSGGSELFLVTEESTTLEKWRRWGYSGVVFDGTELCLRADCIQALYRREWSRPESAWDDLQHLTHHMNDPPLAIDSETVRTDAAWSKAVERLKHYGDQQVHHTRERLEAAIQESSAPSTSACNIA